MREIKFRGKAKNTGRWVYGDLITSPNGLIKSILVNEERKIPEHERFYIISKEKENEYFLNNKVYEVDPETVGQYIEKKDELGKEIYENDVIEIRNINSQLQKMVLRGIVIFSHGSYGIEIEHIDEWAEYNVVPPEMIWFLNIIDTKCYKVIGNACDNKDALVEK